MACAQLGVRKLHRKNNPNGKQTDSELRNSFPLSRCTVQRMAEKHKQLQNQFSYFISLLL